MRTVIRTVIVSVVVAIFLGSCATKEMIRVRNMPIRDVDLNRVPDGSYEGEFTYGGFTYRTRTRVINHRITDIQVSENRGTRHARKAEGVIPRVLSEQTPDVDAVTGATTTSKALLKSIEISLTAGASPGTTDDRR